VQDLNRQSFGGLLSLTAMHAVAGMGKTREHRLQKELHKRDRRDALAPDLASLLV
jgi:hypothetical protein